MALRRMAFCYPIRLQPALGGDGQPLTHEDGSIVRETIPSHATRLARATDVNCWLEDDAPSCVEGE